MVGGWLMVKFMVRECKDGMQFISFSITLLWDWYPKFFDGISACGRSWSCFGSQWSCWCQWQPGFWTYFHDVDLLVLSDRRPICAAAQPSPPQVAVLYSLRQGAFLRGLAPRGLCHGTSSLQGHELMASGPWSRVLAPKTWRYSGGFHNRQHDQHWPTVSNVADVVMKSTSDSGESGMLQGPPLAELMSPGARFRMWCLRGEQQKCFYFLLAKSMFHKMWYPTDHPFIDGYSMRASIYWGSPRKEETRRISKLSQEMLYIFRPEHLAMTKIMIHLVLGFFCPSADAEKTHLLRKRIQPFFNHQINIRIQPQSSPILPQYPEKMGPKKPDHARPKAGWTTWAASFQASQKWPPGVGRDIIRIRWKYRYIMLRVDIAMI